MTLRHPTAQINPFAAVLRAQAEASRQHATVLDATADALEAAPSSAARMSPRWLAVADAGVPQRTLRRAARAGELALHRIGRADFIEADALDRWLSSRPARASKVAPLDDVDLDLARGALRAGARR